MSGSNNSDRGPLIILWLLAICVISVALIGLGTNYISRYETQNRWNQSYKGDSEDIRAILASLDQFDPLEDSIAQWAMAVLALFATGASIGALIYLKLTLDSMRESKALENRAWLDVGVSSAGKMHVWPDGRYNLSVKASLNNVGSGVAVKIRMTTKMVMVSTAENFVTTIRDRIDDIVVGATTRPPPSAIFAGAEKTVTFGAISDEPRLPDVLRKDTLEGHCVYASFKVEYETASDPGTIRQTEKVLAVTPMGSGVFFKDSFDIVSDSQIKEVHLSYTDLAEGRVT